MTSGMIPRMLPRWTSLRYALARGAETGRVISEEIESGLLKTSSAVFTRSLEIIQTPLTEVIEFGGTAMIPTFNSNPTTVGERLLVRTIPSTSVSPVWVGDVVAVRNPEDPAQLLVRRVMAVPGDEMGSTDEADEDFEIPEDHCWLLCDNESIPGAEAVDSRRFGPVAMDHIVGRVIYSCASLFDHGNVKNSEDALEKDAPILEGELDVERLAGQGQGGKGGGGGAGAGGGAEEAGSGDGGNSSGEGGGSTRS